MSRTATATIARIRELTGKSRARVGWPEEFAGLALSVVQNPCSTEVAIRLDGAAGPIAYWLQEEQHENPR
jgi:hypothetical protein